MQPAAAPTLPSIRPAESRRGSTGRAPSETVSARPASAPAAARPPGHAAAGHAAPPVRIIRKRGTAEIRELKRRVEDLERQIHALERRIAEIGAMLTNPKLYLDGDRVRAVSRERKEAEERMSGLLREWEDLATALAGHE